MKKILVAYGSTSGSTEEVAREIAKVLKEKGHEAEAIPFAKVEGLEGYGAVVVGAPVNGMSWMREATAFVSKNAATLARLPTALFLLSGVLIEGRPFMQRKARECLNPAAALVKPLMTATWGGVLPGDPPLPIRLMFGIRKGAKKDGRDWDLIRSWAREFAATA